MYLNTITVCKLPNSYIARTCAKCKTLMKMDSFHSHSRGGVRGVRTPPPLEKFCERSSAERCGTGVYFRIKSGNLCGVHKTLKLSSIDNIQSALENRGRCCEEKWAPNKPLPSQEKLFSLTSPKAQQPARVVNLIQMDRKYCRRKNRRTNPTRQHL